MATGFRLGSSAAGGQLSKAGGGGGGVLYAHLPLVSLVNFSAK